MRATLAGCFTTVALLASQPVWATVFQSHQVINNLAGSNPRAVTSADVNNDGNIDLAVTSSATDQMVVLWGDGDRGFAAPAFYDTGANPYSIASAILSSGNVDLVTANRDADTISVFLNDIDGTFDDHKTDYAAGDGPVFVLAAQLDGVNNNDLVTANSDGNSISVFLNDGTGAFPARVDYSTNLSTPVGVAAADVDGDTDLDLAVINQGNNSVAIFLNDGGGTFTFATSYATGATPYAIAAGDLDGDTFADLVISNSGSDTVSVLMNNGDGSFATKVDHATGTTPHAVVLGDLDQDGDLDIAVTNNASDSVSVFENQGVSSGTFNNGNTFSSVQMPSGLALGNLDIDSYPELITTNLLNGNISYLANLAPITPDPFSFPAKTGVTPGAEVTSDPITIAGLAAGAQAPIIISANEIFNPDTGTVLYNAKYSINDGPFRSEDSVVVNGDVVRVQLKSDSENDTTVVTTLTVGGFSTTFSVTTAGDAIPDNFSISPRVDAEPNEVVISNPVTITGLGAPATIIISTGEYRINGGSFTSAPGTISNNDVLEVRLTASSNYDTQRQSLLSIGGVERAFLVVTRDNPNRASAAGGGGNLSPWGALLLAALCWRQRNRQTPRA